MGSGSVPEFRSCPYAEQAVRPPQKNADGCRINKESAELGDPVLARGVGDADEERRNEGAAQAAQAANGDDDQEVDQVLEGIAPEHGQDVGADGAAQAGEPAAERE